MGSGFWDPDPPAWFGHFGWNFNLVKKKFSHPVQLILSQRIFVRKSTENGVWTHKFGEKKKTARCALLKIVQESQKTKNLRDSMCKVAIRSGQRRRDSNPPLSKKMQKAPLEGAHALRNPWLDFFRKRPWHSGRRFGLRSHWSGVRIPPGTVFFSLLSPCFLKPQVEKIFFSHNGCKEAGNLRQMEVEFSPEIQRGSLKMTNTGFLPTCHLNGNLQSYFKTAWCAF